MTNAGVSSALSAFHRAYAEDVKESNAGGANSTGADGGADTIAQFCRISHTILRQAIEPDCAVLPGNKNFIDRKRASLRVEHRAGRCAIVA